MAQPLLKNANVSAFKQQLICSLETFFMSKTSLNILFKQFKPEKKVGHLQLFDQKYKLTHV